MSFKHALIPAVAGIALILGCDSKPADKIPTTAPTAIKEPHEVLQHLQYMAVRKDMKHTSLIVPVDPEIIHGSAWWFNKHAGDMGIPYTAEEIKTFGLEPLCEKGYFAAGVTHMDLQAALDKAAAEGQAAPAKKGKAAPSTLPANMASLNQDRLDLLPTTPKLPDGRPNPEFDAIKNNATQLRAALTGGLYRVMKGVPAELWPEVSVMEVKNNPTNTKIKDVYLGFQGTSIMQVSVYQQEPGKPWTVSYVYFKVGAKKLAQVAEKLKAQQAK
jgi:hypothetical protein